MGTRFCVEAVEDAGARFGTPRIFNADQSNPFTSEAFTGVLTQHGIRISMDGKRCWRDNVLIEWLWKPVKHEEVHLRAYDSVAHTRLSIGCYPGFCNGRRPYTALDRTTPDHVYFASLPQPRAA